MNGFWQRLRDFLIPCKDNNFRPRILEKNRFWFYCFLAIIVLKIAIIIFLLGFPKTIFFADISKIALIELTNEQRRTAGLNDLKESSRLNLAAEMKARDMLAGNYFSHQSPKGITPWFWFEKAGYNYKVAGENLGIGFLDSSEVYQAWLDSPTHKANIVSPYYQEIGIAVVEGDFNGSRATIVVQLFGSAKQNIFAPVQPTVQSKSKKVITKVATTTVADTTNTAVTSTEAKKQVLAAVVAESSSSTGQTTTSAIELSVAKSFSTIDAVSEKSSPFRFNLLKFLDKNYNSLVQDINLLALLFILAVGLINIFVALGIQYKDLIVKTGVFAALMLILLILDQRDIIALIPHNFQIR